MIKLILTHITFKTGGRRHQDFYLVSTPCKPGDDHNTLTEIAADVARVSFPTHYPESELISIVPKRTLELQPIVDTVEDSESKDYTPKTAIKKIYTVIEFPYDVKHKLHGSFTDWEKAESAREAVETDENYVEVLITDFPK